MPGLFWMHVSLVAAILLPVTFCSWAVASVLNGLNFVVESFVDLFIGVGNRTLGLFRIGAGGDKNLLPTGEGGTPETSETHAGTGTEVPPKPADAGFNPFDERKWA